MIRLGSLTTSNISARSVRKTSGLFNEGLADDLKSDLKPSAEDLLKSIDNGNDTLMFGLDSGMLTYLDPLAEASLDSFVDLSDYLMEGKPETCDVSAVTETVETEVFMETVDPAVTVSEETAQPSLKRSIDQVEVEEVVDVVNMEEVVTTAPDHDYVSKRPRLSTSSVASDVSGLTDAAVSPLPRNVENKYRERRNKNNVASRRSREVRKQKYVDMDGQADRLEVDNEHLRKKIVELEKLAKEMKATLVSKLASK